MKTGTIIILLLVSMYAYTKDSLNIELKGKSSIQINVLNLLGKDISINYCKFSNRISALELIVGYKFGSKDPDYMIAFAPIDDPWWFYNKISSRIGIRFYIKDKLYIAPMFLFNYGYYDNMLFKKYVDYDGDMSDEDYILSREKYSPGSLLKLGYTYNYKCFIMDWYLGAGFRFDIKKQSINQKIAWDGNPIIDNYPLESYSNSIVPTLHAGIQIGLKFK